MTEPSHSYATVDITRRLRAQAKRVWAVTTAVVLLWVGLIVAAPLLDATAIYHFFSYVCHQIPERSLHIAEHQLAVCSRCFGVYIGLLGGIVTYPLWRPVEETEPVPRIWLILSLIPITIDWSLTVFGIWENTHASRFITGMILGVSCGIFIVPATVEIVRSLTGRRLRAQ